MPSHLQALGWAQRPLPFMRTSRERHGDIFTLRIRRGRPWVFLTDPRDIGKVLTISPELVRAGAGEANPLLGPLLGPRSVMLLDEPEHMTHRKFMLPAFHGERMRSYGEMMVEVAREEIAKWPLGEPFAIWPRMQSISMEVVLRAVFGTTSSEQIEHLRVLLRRLTDWLNEPSRLALLTTFGARWLTRNAGFRAVIEPVEAALLDEVGRRRRSPGRAEEEGILSLLEQAYDEHGAPMTDQELRDELITLVSDGPTATSLAWVFERLLRHPQKLDRLREEVLAGTDDTYTDAVVKEILRLCPAVALVMRGLVEPTTLAGYTIPAGTIVAPCIYLLHHREDIYTHPYAFMPERFLDRSPENYTWLPFGSGVRRCVAASFAQLEMKRVIQTVLSEVDLRAASPGSERATRSSIAFVPDQSGRVIATRRTPATGPGSRRPSPARTTTERAGR
jgi:cytochrome P450 family 135